MTQLTEEQASLVCQALQVFSKHLATRLLMEINSYCLHEGISLELAPGQGEQTNALRLNETIMLMLMGTEIGITQFYGEVGADTVEMTKRVVDLQCVIKKQEDGDDRFEKLFETRYVEASAIFATLATEQAKAQQDLGQAVVNHLQLPMNPAQVTDFAPLLVGHLFEHANQIKVQYGVMLQDPQNASNSLLTAP